MPRFSIHRIRRVDGVDQPPVLEVSGELPAGTDDETRAALTKAAGELGHVRAVSSTTGGEYMAYVDEGPATAPAIPGWRGR